MFNAPKYAPTRYPVFCLLTLLFVLAYFILCVQLCMRVNIGKVLSVLAERCSQATKVR